MNKADLERIGWDRCDFIIVTGDAYVDHPSFGAAIIGRVLLDAGYKVGILAQPDYKNAESFKALGRPRLGFLVTAGNIDSMVNHYYVSRRRRKDDLYSPGGEGGKRPDRATLVYVNKIREAFKKVPIILGGVEASLRRFAHYDYWSDSVRRSMLVDAEADLLIYGMGEKQVVEIAEYMNSGIDIKYIRHIPGTCYLVKEEDELPDGVMIPSFDQVKDDKVKFGDAFLIEAQEQDPIRGKAIIQPHGKFYMVQNPPMMPLNREEMDRVYGLHFMRDIHPSYKEMGGIPAIREVKFSITSSRGCFGNCSFCALAFHQGRIVQSRSHESIIEEAKIIMQDPDFKGYIHDVGGPTANFRAPACKHQLKVGACKHKLCLSPKVCDEMDVNHEDYDQLLRKLREIPGIKKVFVRSGIRYDYLMADKDKTFFKNLVEHHVSGQLKVAPEHIDRNVLAYMGKPAGKIYDRFVDQFFSITNQCGKEQYIVPYLMSSHPGSDLDAAINLAQYLKRIKYQPEQVQDFYPTPGTLSTCMYYTGMDPVTKKPVHIAKENEEKAMQRALLQFSNPRNKARVVKALKEAHREDLIGRGPECLIANDQVSTRGQYKNKGDYKQSSQQSGKGKPSRGGKGKRSDKRNDQRSDKRNDKRKSDQRSDKRYDKRSDKRTDQRSDKRTDKRTDGKNKSTHPNDLNKRSGKNKRDWSKSTKNRR